MENMNGASGTMRLGGKQFKRLAEGVLSAYPRGTSLEQCVRFELDEQLCNIVRTPATLREQVFDLISWAEAGGRVGELIAALRAGNPGNPSLHDVADELSSGTHASEDDLQKIVVSNPELFSDPASWRLAMIRAEWAVCRIERPEGRPWGTGFLVAPNLVMTNHHVVSERYGGFGDRSRNARVRFGFREDADQDVGALYELESDWLWHHSVTEELDYAILRLKGAPGNSPIAHFNGAPQRGWLSMRPVKLEPSQALFLIQHPQGDTLKMANGGLAKIDGAWLSYEVNTDSGSSGSPILSNAWELVGVHSRFGGDAVNCGVSTTAILSDLPGHKRDEVLDCGPCTRKCTTALTPRQPTSG